MSHILLPRNSDNTAVATEEQFVARRPYNQHFHFHAASTTLASPASAEDTSIDVVSVASFAVGDYVHIGNGAHEVVHPKITAIDAVNNTLTLNKPLDNDYVVATPIYLAVIDMAVVGSLASPASYKLLPPTGGVVYITRILIEMEHSSAGDNSLFGNLSPLTNGVVLRVYNGTLGAFTSFTFWQKNSDLKLDMYEVEYDARSGGGGSYGTTAKGTFTDIGTQVKLDDAAGDYAEILIQDDISSLLSFRIKGQGAEPN